MRADVIAEAVFLPADPPREGRLALWHETQSVPDADGEIDVVVPAGSVRVRRTRRPARLLPLREALDMLLAPVDGDASGSRRAWSAAALAGLGLVARGRLRPAVTEGGYGAWRLGPLDPDDHLWLRALADAMPPAAHATPASARPLRLHSPERLVRAFWDALADHLVRSPAAHLVVPEAAAAFATATPQRLAGDQQWLADAERAERAGARLVLRVEPPDEEVGAFRAGLHLRSVADPSLLVPVGELWRSPAAVLARLGDQAESDLLLGLRRAGALWPPALDALAAATPTHVDVPDDELDVLLEDGGDALAAVGVEVLWPAELFGDGVRLRAATRAAPAPGGGPAGFGLDQLLDFQWKATLGGEQLSDDELAALAEAKRPVVRLRGRWVRVDATMLDRLRRRTRRRVTAGEALAAALSGRLDVDGEPVDFAADGPLADLARLLTAGAQGTVDEVAPPAGLEATLRPYQLRGLTWLAHLTGAGLGALLADDMGLGKTLQVIALHLHRGPLEAGPTLVVCPTSLLGNWQREIERFAPGTPVRRFHGGARSLADVGGGEVVLVTYGVVRRDRSSLAEVPWGMVVADEAQHVKNPHSRGARELRALPSAARVALSGTPVENRLSELWALLDWTTPGLLGPLETFRRSLATPVERYRDPEATERLQKVVRPFLLRRRKSDPGIAPELPRKTETDRVIPLTAEQGTLYEAVVRETLAKIAESDGIARRGLVLSLITSLKQICNHPAHFLHETGPLTGRSGKLAAVDELLEVILAEGESVLVFSQYVEMCRLLERHLASRDVGTLLLHGGIGASARETMVSDFQDGRAPVFLLSLKAGGVGLNLTRASHVIHVDRWWNPAVEDQATDRAYRIGQDKPVQVHRLVTEGTVEDRVAALLASKRDLADSVVGSGEGWITELDDEALADLVRLGRPA